MSAIAVRPLAPADEADWRRLWTGYLEFYRTKVSEEVYATLWARLMGDEYYDPRGLGAVVDGRLVGLVHYMFQRHGWRVEEVTYLQDLYTQPSVRRLGVGEALVKGVYAAADAAGCPHVYWLTESNNTVSRRLYDRLARMTDFIQYQR